MRRNHIISRFPVIIVLGGSWVVISKVRSPQVWVISVAILRIALLITTHEPPSSAASLLLGYNFAFLL